MRTAEDIIKTFAEGNTIHLNYETVISAINEARKEAIEECAKVSKIDCPRYSGMICSVDKQSILNLIKELK